MSKQSSKELKNVVSSADHETLKERYSFVPSEQQNPSSWQDRMVQRYHEGLYKEFALADFSRGPGRIGLRWRTHQDVIDGRGEISCGNKQCQKTEELVTLEVPFSYEERGVAKKELVKLRLCPSCKPFVRSKGNAEEGGTLKEHNTNPEKAGRKSRGSDSISRDSDSSDSDTSEDSDRTPKRKKHKQHKRHRHRKRKKRRRSDD